MKNLDSYITEKLHLTQGREDIKIETPVDTTKNDSGTLTPKQKSFVNVFVHSLNEEKRYKTKKLYPGIDITFNDFVDLINGEIDGSDDFVDFFDEMRSTLHSVAQYAEDEPENIKYIFPDFRNMSVEQIRELADIFCKSAKLIQAIYGNILEAGEIGEGSFVTYDENTGKYKDLDVVWDD